jgi:hypothetical protein
MEFRQIARTAEDAAYVTIGFGVLAVQKAQVRRREVQKQLEDQRGQLTEQIAKFAKDLEERIEPVVDGLESRLPENAKVAIQEARKAARERFSFAVGSGASSAS